MFLLYIKRNIFFIYTMSLWVCYRNFKAFVQRYPWMDDIEDKLTRADLNAKKKKMQIKVLA